VGGARQEGPKRGGAHVMSVASEGSLSLFWALRKG